MTSTRLFVGPLGSRYVARLTPREMSWGVATRLNAVVIETDDGRWIGEHLPQHSPRRSKRAWAARHPRPRAAKWGRI